MIFEIQNTIVSDELIKEAFVCNLIACKGACCIEGDAGAPLEESELDVLDEIHEKVKPYMKQEGIDALEIQGNYIQSEDGEWETPLVKGKACAYVVYDDKNTALCAIEKSYNKGDIHWKKPISCHLYPVRTKVYKEFVGVNYNEWNICGDACKLGSKLNIPVYKFLKEPLIRKFGESWYNELDLIANHWKKK